jgi:signal transduction histidine kinase
MRRYFLEIVGAAVLSTLLTHLYNSTVIPWSGRPQYLGSNDRPIIIFIRVIFCFLFIAATHELQRNLKEKLQEAEARNQILLDQYKVLIDADEEIRGQASRYLHDRVQSEIMLASTKLKRRVGEIGHGQDEQITESIHQLEKIRSVDLKLVSQILTPNIEAEGIGGSIENLCRQYSSNFSYECEIEPAVETLDREQLLGIFRIVEQAVINSITHGPAQTVSIKITSEIDGEFSIAISDDGPGSDSTETGTGTVIIDAWVSILKGRKEVKSNLGKGYELLVTFPGK